jgi:pimeloyl-ACP methyl ester carboxylesterase
MLERMSPNLTVLRVRGVDLAVWEWPGEGPTFLFAHATGFHARCWDEVIRGLARGRAIALDMRGHGRSEKPKTPYCWREFGEDVAETARLLDLRGAIGVGHSMGGHSIALAAALRPDAFASLLLVDPTIFARQYYGRPQRHDSSFIARRRNDWASPEEMFERFRSRPPFAQWRVEVLRDYCEYGVLPAGDRYVLACPPEIEASIYAGSNAAEADIYPLLGRIEIPVTVVRGGIPWNTEKFDLAASPTAPGLAGEFPKGRDVFLEGRSHYIPMESPEIVAEHLATNEHE